MFSAQIKNIFAAASVALLMAACGSGSDNKNPDSLASPLLLEARHCFDSGDYARSLSLLDSIDHAYPQAIESRKDGRLLRPQVVERLAMQRLSEADSMLVVNSIRGEELRDQLEFVSGTGVEGYYVGKGTRGTDVRQTAGLHSRVSPDFHFYLIASSPKAVSSIAIELQSGGESVRSESVAFDGERNTRNSQCETITFTEAESAPIGEFVANHSDKPITVVFIGSNGATTSMALDQQQRDAIMASYGLMSAINADRHYRLEKERLTKQVDIARQQLANVAAKQ